MKKINLILTSCCIKNQFQLHSYTNKRQSNTILDENTNIFLIKKYALKHVEYHVRNELPVQVRCAILDAWGWCTGTTQRDGVGREEGGGFRMGNTCMPVVDSF